MSKESDYAFTEWWETTGRKHTKLSIDDALLIWDAALEWSRPIAAAAVKKAREEKKRAPKPPKPPKGIPKGFVLPEWISPEAWLGFHAMRERIRAPLTERAIELTIGKLSKLKEQGHDPIACLDQSTQKAWRGVFEVHENGNSNGNRGKAEDDWLSEK